MKESYTVLHIKTGQDGPVGGDSGPKEGKEMFCKKQSNKKSTVTTVNTVHECKRGIDVICYLEVYTV